MEPIFVKTNNYAQFAEICDELGSDSGRVGPSLALIWGRAGRGKSEAARYYAVNRGAVYVRTLPIMTPLAVLREVAFDLVAEKPHTTARCLEIIQRELRSKRRVILIDEADLLRMDVLETLRGVNEIAGAPVVLIGEEQLAGRVASRRRIVSRIRLRQEFGPLVQPDIAVFFKHAMHLELQPDCVAELYRLSGGDWRPMLKGAIDLERSMRASGAKAVSLQLVKAILGNNQP